MSSPPRGTAARVGALVRSGVTSARLSPLRSLVSVACVTAGLAPYLAGLGVTRGLLDETAAGIRDGADVHVSGLRHGRAAPLPLGVAERLAAIPGVAEVTPRVVGSIRIGKERESAVVVGLPADHFPASLAGLEGRLPSGGDALELVFGGPLAGRLGITVGAHIPPFYRSSHGERVATVVGVLTDDAPLWAAHVILTSFAGATEIFDAPGQATDFALRVTPGYEEGVKVRVTTGDPVQTASGPVRLGAVTRPELASFLPRGILDREGVLSMHFVLAFALGIPLLLVVSGLGLSERRRETGLLRATGWAADEILLRNLAESALLTTAGAALSILVAYVWLGLLGGRGVVGIFVPGADAARLGRLPYRLQPEPALIGVVVAFAVVMTGTVWSSWRAASTPPAETMR